jgi:Putative transposase
MAKLPPLLPLRVGAGRDREMHAPCVGTNVARPSPSRHASRGVAGAGQSESSRLRRLNLISLDRAAPSGTPRPVPNASRRQQVNYVQIKRIGQTLDVVDRNVSLAPFDGSDDRYAHRVAISNQRLLALDDERGVTFRWKDYRATGKTRYQAMTLDAGEFMRRFLLHILPSGFHRIRHYGLLANTGRREHLARARELLHVVPATAEPLSPDACVAFAAPTFICPHCGAAMIIVETFARAEPIRGPTLPAAA